MIFCLFTGSKAEGGGVALKGDIVDIGIIERSVAHISDGRRNGNSIQFAVGKGLILNSRHGWRETFGGRTETADIQFGIGRIRIQRCIALVIKTISTWIVGIAEIAVAVINEITADFQTDKAAEKYFQIAGQWQGFEFAAAENTGLHSGDFVVAGGLKILPCGVYILGMDHRWHAKVSCWQILCAFVADHFGRAVTVKAILEIAYGNDRWGIRYSADRCVGADHRANGCCHKCAAYQGNG